ncbi:hypothetical protein KCV07_g6729, partial [Aureobasidium melanogenum]
LHLLPNLIQLELESETWHFPFTRQWLRPLQGLKLETLRFQQKVGQASFYVEDLELQDISSMFGNQQTLKNLSVAFGSSNNPTFLQHDLASAAREIIVHYPNLTALSLPLPCGTFDLMEMSDVPLQSKITHLNFWRLETPPGSFTSTSLAYKLNCYKFAIKLAEHFPYLEQLTAIQSTKFAARIFEMYVDIKTRQDEQQSTDFKLAERDDRHDRQSCQYDRVTKGYSASDESLCFDKMLEEFADYPEWEVRQQFAMSMQTIDWEIYDDTAWDFTQFQFPRMENLQIQFYNGPLRLPPLNQFIRPRLKELVVVDHDGDPLRSSSNYIPLLVNCRTLRTLWIEIDPGASDVEFLAALTACRDQIFQHLACQSRLTTFYYVGAGFSLTQDLIQPTLDTLSPGQTIFNHLTLLKTSMTGAVARELFPHMPTISTLTLYIDQEDDIVDRLVLLPQLDTLALKARADVSLTPLYLAGLQNIQLSYLEIGGEDRFNFNGIRIDPDDIDTLFGSHATLGALSVAWLGDTGTQVNHSFLQYQPSLLIERVLTNYRALRILEMPGPCGAVDLKMLPFAPLNGTVTTLSVEHVVPPRVNPRTRPEEYKREILYMACQLIKHFPDLEDWPHAQTEAFIKDVLEDFRTMKRAGL